VAVTLDFHADCAVIPRWDANRPDTRGWHGNSNTDGVQIVFATGARYWEPTGPTMWFTVFSGLLGAFILNERAGVPKPIKLRLWCLLPFAMVAGCLLAVFVESWSWLGYYSRNFYAELAVAYLISWAFGVGYCISAWRSGNIICRTAAVLAGLAFAALLYPAWQYWVGMRQSWAG